MRRISLVIVLLLLSTAADAQKQGDQAVADPVVTAYQLGFTTGQAVTTAQINADEKLKWVLDNWVPKHDDKR